MDPEPVRGTGLCGDEPRRLALSDGSRLLLDGTSGRSRRPEWHRLGRRRPERLSIEDAAGLAGDEYADYVEVRTRAEAEWMRAVADWYREQADVLEGDLERALRSR